MRHLASRGETAASSTDTWSPRATARGEGRFPDAMAVAGVDVDIALSAEDF